MRKRLVGLMVLAIGVAATGVVFAGAQGETHDDAYRQAKEQMADLLASEEFEKVDVAASSYDRAMTMIYIAVDTYLDQVVPTIDDVELVREFGIDVLKGLNEHRIHYAGDDGYTLAGKRRLLISNDTDAEDWGEVLARVTLLIHGGHGKPGFQAQRAADRIFEGMLPVEGTGQPLVKQYLVRLRMLSKADQKQLVKSALE